VLRQPSILIVEDGEDDRELILRALRDGGTDCDVRVATSQDAFIAALGTGPDLILADYRMAGLGAMRALQILAERDLDIPLIVVTGVLEDAGAVETIKAGAWDYVLKDHLEHLPVVVEHVLRHREIAGDVVRAEDRFHGLVDGLPAIVYTAEVGATGRWKYVSPKIFDILGFTVEEWAPGKLWTEQLHPSDLARVLREEEEGCTRGGSFESEYRLYTKDGRIVWVQDHETVLKDEAGVPLHVQGFMLDVTDRKRAELLAAARIRQQSALAAFGNVALTESDVARLNKEACVVLAETLGVRFSKVLELQPEGHFLITAGVGWNDSILGSTVAGDSSTQAGYALHQGAAVLVEDLRTEERFQGSSILHGNGLISGVSVLIGAGVKPYGVLSVHDQRHRTFSSEDVDFVKAIANVIAQAIQREHSFQEVRFGNSLLNRVDAAMVAMDVENNVTYWNKGAERLYGWSSEEAIGRSAVSLLGVDESDDLVMEIATMLANDEAWEGEWAPHRKDGVAIPVFGSVASLLDEAGAFAGTVTVSVDISERKGMELALRDSEARTTRILDGLPFGIVVLDPEGQAVFVNAASTSMLGKGLVAYEKLAEIPEIYQLNLKGTDDPYPADRLPVAAALQGQPARADDLEIVRPNGRTPLEVWGTPIFDPDGKLEFAVTAFSDTTQRVRLEEQLSQSAKLEAVGSLAAGIAHDFNNLLSVVLNFASFVLTDTPAQDPRRKDLEEVVRAAERGADLVRQLLTFSRKKIVVPSVLDVNQIVTETTELLRRTLGEDVELRLALDPDIGATKMDAGEVQQVLINLAINARDAMPGGGTLTIETNEVNGDGGFAGQLLPVPPGRYVRMSVSDTGMGMTDETKQRIFEPFFTTKGRSQGTGLGLATIYGIVKQAGGSIWVYSEVNEGTTFKIYLPVTSQPVEAAKPNPAGVPMRSGDGRSVLVVEDEPGVRRLVGRILDQAGFDVLTAPDGESALAVAAAFVGKIDMVLTDVIMPQMTGKQLADKLALLRPDTRTLYMSGYTDEIVADRGTIATDEWFIQKPFNSADLLRKISEVLVA
jgi:two-component system cell cycle sensor histidine kinase/response regulator CckA